MLVAVVAGKPAVIGSRPVASADKNGASAPWLRSRYQPIPSTRRRHPLRNRGSPRTAVMPRTPRPARMDGVTSERAAAPYCGTRGFIVGDPPRRQLEPPRGVGNLPEVHARERPVGAPWLGDPGQMVGARHRWQLVSPLDAAADLEITHGQDVE